MLKFINGLFKEKVNITIITRGGVIVDVKGNLPVQYTVKDLDDIPPLCMTCGERCNGLTDVCINGHDNWLEDVDVKAENEHYHRAVNQSGYNADTFKLMFYNPRNKFIKQDKRK
jgi:hypothetical protein